MKQQQAKDGDTIGHGGEMMLETVLVLVKVGALLFIAFCFFKIAYTLRKAGKKRAKLWEDYLRGIDKGKG